MADSEQRVFTLSEACEKLGITLDTLRPLLRSLDLTPGGVSSHGQTQRVLTSKQVDILDSALREVNRYFQKSGRQAKHLAAVSRDADLLGLLQEIRAKQDNLCAALVVTSNILRDIEGLGLQDDIQRLKAHVEDIEAELRVEIEQRERQAENFRDQMRALRTNILATRMAKAAALDDTEGRLPTMMDVTHAVLPREPG